MSSVVRKLGFFERYLTIWVLLCIGIGILLGKAFPSMGENLDRISVAQVSIPIAICLFFMMYPIMVKIDFAEVIKAGKTPKPVILTLFVNWCVKPFTMVAIATFFLGFVFKGALGGDAILDGASTYINPATGMAPPLYRSYISGCILLGIAPCTAMVLVWSYLSKGNDGHTLVMVAINSLAMLVLYAPLGGWLLGVNSMPVPWLTIILSITFYVALPLVAGYFSHKWILKRKGIAWFQEKFVHYLTPVTIIALLVTLIILFSLKGQLIVDQPMTIVYIAIPLLIQTILIFWLGYSLAKWLKLRYRDAAPAAIIGASNHFEVAIATATVLFGIASGAALATVVGVLIEVPVMLMLVRICLRTQHWFKSSEKPVTIEVSEVEKM
ncbi:MAG: ACR3 family arsenite efflux transporter [Actinomycetota bacterium]|nr:ACR3 family arsenite efflux transporter [Actinomycetota bacterium]